MTCFSVPGSVTLCGACAKSGSAAMNRMYSVSM
jgi:hypothetical protein